jgi:hypothetical protein
MIFSAFLAYNSCNLDEEQSRPASRHSHDAILTNETSSVSGVTRSSARSRGRPMPTSYTYWLNTGDNTNHPNANFMRLTYAATCRSRLSRSVERCPRACRGILAACLHILSVWFLFCNRFHRHHCLCACAAMLSCTRTVLLSFTRIMIVNNVIHTKNYSLCSRS